MLVLNETNLIISRPYTGFSVDLWNAGVVLFVMVTGLMPYDDQSPRRMLEKQLQHKCLLQHFEAENCEVISLSTNSIYFPNLAVNIYNVKASDFLTFIT